MKIRKAKKCIACLLSLTVLLSVMLVPSATASTAIDGHHLNGEAYRVERVTHPENGVGDIDGLNINGDRASSYCWAIAENKGYVYIGTWSNGLYQTVMSIGQLSTSVGSTLSQDTVDKMMLALTQGQVDPCEPDSYKSAKIYRCNERTGEVDLLFDPADYPSGDYSEIYGFRGAITFKGDVYMDAMLNSGATNCQLWRVTDENPFDTPELVLENGSLRAICTSVDGNYLYSGGSCEIPEGYKSGAVIFESDTGDYGDFDVIADSKDFELYTRNGDSITVNDVICYKNPDGSEEVIASLVTSFGVAVFRGHKASDAEVLEGKANEFGWIWNEFIGVNGEYPISLGNNLNCTLTPAVFNDELYFMSMTNPMTPMMIAGMGIVANNKDYLYMGIDQMAATLDSECAVYRQTTDGKVQMVMGDKKFCPDSVEYVAKLGAGFNNDEYSTTMYAWREVTYNGRMYINTIDIWNLYSYFTTLTNGQLLGLNQDEFKNELGYVIGLLKALSETKSDNDDKLSSTIKEIEKFISSSDILTSLTQKQIDSLYDILYKLYSEIDKEATTDTVEFLINNGITLSTKISGIADSLIKSINNSSIAVNDPELAAKLVSSIEKIVKPFTEIANNKTHLENYMLISETVANHKTPGGEVWCSENGVDWDPITVDGFGDKFNHGIRTMVVGEDGSLYLGTANPYYGAQLWKTTDSGEIDPNYTPDTAPDSGNAATENTITTIIEFLTTLIYGIINFVQSFIFGIQPYFEIK